MQSNLSLRFRLLSLKFAECSESNTTGKISKFSEQSHFRVLPTLTSSPRFLRTSESFPLFSFTDEGETGCILGFSLLSYAKNKKVHRQAV